MKQLLTILLLLGSTLGVVFAQEEVVFDSESHNFGKIEESGGQVSHTFKFTNNSATPYVITDVQTGCGCTTPEYSKKPTLQGKSGEVTITYDPMNRPGRILKTIIITSNLGVKRLTVDGTVNPRELSLEEKYPFIIGGGARLNHLSESRLGVPLSKSLRIKIGIANSNTKSSVEVDVDRDKLPEGVSVSLSKNVVEPRGEQEMIVEIRGESYGVFRHYIPLVINGKSGMESVILAGAVIDNYSDWGRELLGNAPKSEFSTTMIRGGNVKLGSEQEYSFEIRNKGGSDLIVREMSSSSSVEATLSSYSIGVGESGKVKVRYTPSQEGYDSQVLRFVVNDPKNSVVEVRLIVEVRD